MCQIVDLCSNLFCFLGVVRPYAAYIRKKDMPGQRVAEILGISGSKHSFSVVKRVLLKILGPQQQSCNDDFVRSLPWHRRLLTLLYALVYGFGGANFGRSCDAADVDNTTLLGSSGSLLAASRGQIEELRKLVMLPLQVGD